MTENQRIRLQPFSHKRGYSALSLQRRFANSPPLFVYTEPSNQADDADPEKGGSCHDNFFQSFHIFTLTCMQPVDSQSAGLK